MTATSLVYKLESFPVFWLDSAECRAEHGEEMRHDPRMLRKEDEDTYMLAWLSGLLQIVTARADGKIVGYFVTALRFHPHYKDTLAAYEDAYYLMKAYRKGLAGVRLIREAEAFAHDSGAQIFYISLPHENERQATLMTRLGFAPDYVTHSKWIGATAPAEV